MIANANSEDRILPKELYGSLACLVEGTKRYVMYG